MDKVVMISKEVIKKINALYEANSYTNNERVIVYGNGNYITIIVLGVAKTINIEDVDNEYVAMKGIINTINDMYENFEKYRNDMNRRVEYENWME